MESPSGRSIIEWLRRELAEENKAILEHPFIQAAEAGRLSRSSLEAFIVNQLYIVPHDLRSLLHLASRSLYDDEVKFFMMLAEGDAKALVELRKLASELGVSYSPEKVDPRAVAYTHYLSWLALHATLGEAAVALIVNLPVWGSNVCKLARILRESYGVKEVGFLELFCGPYESLEEASYPIVERYYNPERYLLAARMIQAYERMFWDVVYEAGSHG